MRSNHTSIQSTFQLYTKILTKRNSLRESRWGTSSARDKDDILMEMSVAHWYDILMEMSVARWYDIIRLTAVTGNLKSGFAACAVLFYFRLRARREHVEVSMNSRMAVSTPMFLFRTENSIPRDVYMMWSAKKISRPTLVRLASDSMCSWRSICLPFKKNVKVSYIARARGFSTSNLLPFTWFIA